MRSNHRNCFFWCALLSGLAFCGPSGAQGLFTLQVGSPAAPPTPLVNHGDTWNFYKPTNGAPIANWQTVADGALPATWGSGPGGFGYGDPAITNTAPNYESTMLNDMQNRYTTFYIRKSFNVSSPFDPAQRIRLTVDYDDGFVAYLDGAEIARRNLTNGPGTVVEFNATTGGASHEASCCNAPTNAPESIDVGAVGSRLDPGSHILALQGVNQTNSSSDFHLIADFSVPGTAGTVSGGTFFALVTTNSVTLLGSNTLAGSTRVVVNGLDASFDPATGTWSKTQSLAPGVNRLFVAALDSNGNILTSTNRDLIYEPSSTGVGGTLGANTGWTGAMGIIHATNNVVVPSGVTLSIGPGVVVLLGPGVSIQATAGGTIEIAGTEASPDFFLPLDGTSSWGALNASGSGASLTARYMETAAGAVTFNSGGGGLVEDSYLHDRPSIITANSAGFITLRRLHVNRYEETIFNSGTIILAEDNLYENMSIANADALEIQGGPPGSIIRRCTFRHSFGSNSDAVDCNGTSGARIESCLIHDFSDKAVSMGASGAGGAADFGMVISNCLIYRVDTGIAAKDGGTASLYNTTISESTLGVRSYQKFTSPIGGGNITNGFNNIIWGNGIEIQITNNGSVLLDYSDVQGTNWPGTGNISADPLFVNAAAHDYRLSAGSPARGTGLGSSDMGVQFPVGGIPSPPFNLAAHASGTNVIEVWWQENADNEAGFAIERSIDAANWQAVGLVAAGVTNFTDSSAVLDQFYFYRVRATNSSGASLFSNLAGAVRQLPMTVVGGTLSGNTTWSPAMGMILVLSNVTVPTNVTLTVEAGTFIKLTNAASVRAAAGGTINIDGTENSPVVLSRWNGTNVWGEIAADGANSSLTIHQADISGGAVKFRNGATGLMEDSYVHDYKPPAPNNTIPIAGCTSGKSVTVRRCHFSIYHETLWQFTLITIEDSLFENANNVNSDALDFDGAPDGSVIRRCTFRHGPQSNTDAIDLGSTSFGVLVEDCLMYDFPNDKGVSIGETTYAIVIRNCLMYGCDSGVAVKDDCTASIFSCTIVENDYGFRNFNKTCPTCPTGGGHITNAWNNILWNNRTNISLLNNSTLTADHSDFGATNWPGTGNISLDPLFLNAAQRDYRLLSGSPGIGTGRNGADMGAHFPVGAPMAASHPSFQSVMVSDGIVTLRFWADSEKSYTVQRSEQVSGGTWVKVADVAAPPLPRLVTITDMPPPGDRFYRLVTPQQP